MLLYCGKWWRKPFPSSPRIKPVFRLARPALYQASYRRAPLALSCRGRLMLCVPSTLYDMLELFNQLITQVVHMGNSEHGPIVDVAQHRPSVFVYLRTAVFSLIRWVWEIPLQFSVVITRYLDLYYDRLLIEVLLMCMDRCLFSPLNGEGGIYELWWVCVVLSS